MLAEFAFTPSIFEEAAQSDPELWREQLRELGANMFPRTAAWPVMISDLYGGSWQQEAVAVVEAIKDPTARNLCQGFLRNVAHTLVRRPAHGDWPGEDAIAWGREAIGSHGDEPIDRIVACQRAFDLLSATCSVIRNIDEVRGAGFWKDVESAWPQEMRIGDQVQALRKVCVHSDFLVLVASHIHGTGWSDETDFAVDLIKSTFRRPKGYPPAEVEIHVEAPADPQSADYHKRLANLKANIARHIRSGLPAGQNVRLVLWPKLLDRYVVAGIYTATPGGVRCRSPRWGVSMQHIARKMDDQTSLPPTSWSLMSKRQLGETFEQYAKDGVMGFADTMDVT